MNLAEAHIHFVGIGGIGMSGIAEVLVNMGCSVTGSDTSKNSQVERLEALGVQISSEHRATSLPDKCDALVFSSAVKANNPELVEARRRKIPIIQRAEMLAELMGLRRGIAIAGTHGKTTTTSMIATMLLSAQQDPTIVIGGRLDLIKSTAALGKGEWFVAEADESDGSFLRLSPEIVVVTNIDSDHLDHYKDFTHLQNTFSEFCRKIPFYGVAILCIDDPFVAKLAAKFDKRMMTYGFNSKARLKADNLKVNSDGQTFNVSLDGKAQGTVTLKVPGRHNVLNALAAVAVGLELKLPFTAISEGLSQYRGVDRRLQTKGTFNGATVIDDYGHHPTEVRATLSALRQIYPKDRLIVAFQPHRYSRTKACWKEFLSCFNEADVVGILDIYPAGEKRLSQIDSKRLAKAASRKNKNVQYWGNLKLAKQKVGPLLRQDDIFLTLGAGDVWKLGAELVEKKMTLESLTQKNVALAPHTSWLIGGEAQYFAEPTQIDDLQKILRVANEEKVSVTVLGGGTNVLVSDGGIKGLVISTGKLSGIEIIESQTQLKFWAKAGTNKSELLKIFLKYKLAPAKMLAGLPGQVGGGVVMNAGVSENLTPREFVEITKAIEVMRPNGDTEIILAKNLDWNYRHCEGWKPGIITRVQISWPMEPDEKIISEVKFLNQTRLKKQPLEWPSCGSVFRNPKPDSAGALIEKAGLKGHTIGGAQISEKHGNFIINRGNAKATDVEALIKLCQKTILEKFSVQLKSEVVFLK